MKKSHRISGFGNTTIKNLPFHAFFFHFRSSLEMLEFVDKTTQIVYEPYVKGINHELDQMILKLNKKQRNEYDRIKKYLTNKRPKSSIKIRDKRVQELVGYSDSIHDNLHEMSHFFNEMSLVYMITKFKEFVKNELILLYLREPRILSSAQVKFLHIRGKTPSETEVIVAEKYAQELSSGEIEDIGKYLEDKVGLPISSLKDWKNFKERFYRRNVLIHHQGIPDEIYFQKTGSKKRIVLTVSDNYLKESRNIFDKFAHEITDYLEKKFGIKKYHQMSEPFYFAL